mmetsp:Transcript_114671/g.244645  ORF Transcript_114671/g.244645 Transcript_114671/m.244645 type:complete len:214 (+) Transcript_114671:709-1350(+)
MPPHALQAIPPVLATQTNRRTGRGVLATNRTCLHLAIAQWGRDSGHSPSLACLGQTNPRTLRRHREPFAAAPLARWQQWRRSDRGRGCESGNHGRSSSGSCFDGHGHGRARGCSSDRADFFGIGRSRSCGRGNNRSSGSGRSRGSNGGRGSGCSRGRGWGCSGGRRKGCNGGCGSGCGSDRNWNCCGGVWSGARQRDFYQVRSLHNGRGCRGR